MQEMELTQERDRRKREVLACIEAADSNGQYSEEGYEALQRSIEALRPLSPIPQPLDEQEKVAGPWKTLFASFGARHSAGKTLVHDTTLKIQSFSKFPDVPVRCYALEQEIHAGTLEYNNIAYLEAPGNGARASVITRGTYAEDDDNRERYQVTFHSVELVSDEGLDDAALRAAFGLDAEAPLRVELKANFHSDVVYCDEELRINYGGMGGCYVLERLHHTGRSVDFSQ